ncbi:hypothetical protein ABT275_19865 [Streptomyces sp. NPDC001185]|uniref:hypothetical protein n=1 Tax=Streptomyces sp. NPDC001185 TaxID=3154380 RepID=UPI0033221399
MPASVPLPTPLEQKSAVEGPGGRLDDGRGSAADGRVSVDNGRGSAADGRVSVDDGRGAGLGEGRGVSRPGAGRLPVAE